MKKPAEQEPATSLRDKIVGLSESSGRKSYYPLLQEKIRQLQDEIAERHRADRALRETLERIQRQQTAIAEISTNPAVFHGLLADAAPMMTESMAEALDVRFASLWLLQNAHMVCINAYDTATDTHASGEMLACTGCPSYVQALAQGPVAAGDALGDPRTSEFAESYLIPNGIGAILDVPVFLDATLTAVICFEHATVTREWQPDEITFASRIADQVALMLTNHQRRQAEEQLREAHATLTHTLRFTESLLDAIPIPVFYKDAAGRYLGCNCSFTEVMGLSAEELRGRTAPELWPELAPLYTAHDTALLEGTADNIYEATIRNRHGELREVIFAKRTYAAGDLESGGIIGSFLDVTDRNRSAKENQQLRNLLANIINSMPSMLIGVDATGHVAQWNLQAAKATGIGEDEARGRTLEHVMPWLQSEMDKVRQAISSRRPSFNGKVSRIVNGETLYEDVTIYPLVTNGIEGAVIRIDNVTERVRIEEMLIQSEKMLSVGGLAAGMAHEINNPLASIMGNAQILETRLLHDLPQNQSAAQEAAISLDQLRMYLDRRGIPKMISAIRSSGAQAAQIVTNMLNFSRKSPAMLVPEDLTYILDRTLELACTDFDLKKNYDFKKIEIIREYADEVPQILASSSKLQQVFLNILRNGAEALREKTFLEQSPHFILRVRDNAPWIRVEIEDNGPGMEPAVRKRIFEPFFTTKPVGRGTGLGLSVSYFIITEEHGGLMDVETMPGEWTRFVIDLPKALPDATERT